MNLLFLNMQIVECPRDAMQGIDTFIPTQIKINYLNLDKDFYVM